MQGKAELWWFISIHIQSVWVLRCEYSWLFIFNVLRIFWCEFRWMKGDWVCSFGAFDAELVFSTRGSENSMTPCWPAGTLDMSRLFEDKSCRTVSLETLGQTVQKLFLKSKIRKTFSKVWSHIFDGWILSLCISKFSNVCCILPVGSWQLIVQLSAAYGQSWGPAEPASQVTPGNRGQHFAWQASSVMNWREWKGREWNEEEKKKRTGKRANIFNSCSASRRCMVLSAEDKGSQKEEDPQPGSFISSWCHSQHRVYLRLCFHDVHK